MDSPTLPDAHQQIRLGDIQASAQKWTAAIGYYSRAIEYFEAIQSTLRDPSLISIIQPQIVQCEKAINFYRLKDRSEQSFVFPFRMKDDLLSSNQDDQILMEAMKAAAAHSSKIARAHSVSSIKPAVKINRPMTRHNTIQLQNTTDADGREGMDSLAAMFFPNHRRKSVESAPEKPKLTAIKKTKNDSQKMEELQTSNEALRNHLKAAMEHIEQLKHEIHEKRENEVSEPQQVVFGLLPTNHEDNHEQEEEESELAATV